MWWPCNNIFSHPRVVIYFFPTSPIKTDTVTAKGRRLINNNNNPPGAIKPSRQSTAFVLGFCSSLCLLPASASCEKILS
jgi:hypothetical protein